MAQITIEMDDQLAAVVAELGRAEQRGLGEIVRSAINQYALRSTSVSVPVSVKVGQASVSVSVKDEGARPQLSLEERKRLLERTAGMWAGKGIDGLDYQRELRAEC